MALHQISLNTDPYLEPYRHRARAARAAAVRAAWKALSRAVAASFRGLAESFRRARRARRTAEALSGLSDRQLKDIGLTRGEIRAVAHAAAVKTAVEAAVEPGVTLAELRRAEAARTGDPRRARPAPPAAPARGTWQDRRGRAAA